MNRLDSVAPLTQSLHERHATLSNRSLTQDPTSRFSGQRSQNGLVDVDELTFLSHEDERRVHRTLASEALSYSPKNASMVIVFNVVSVIVICRSGRRKKRKRVILTRR